MNNLFANCRIRTWNRAELSYECFIINLFANCRIRTWSRAELSYECFIINLFTNCRSRTWSRAGPSTCFNAGCALSLKTMEMHVSFRSKNTIPVFFQLRSKRAKNLTARSQSSRKQETTMNRMISFVKTWI